MPPNYKTEKKIAYWLSVFICAINLLLVRILLVSGGKNANAAYSVCLSPCDHQHLARYHFDCTLLITISIMLIGNIFPIDLRWLSDFMGWLGSTKFVVYIGWLSLPGFVIGIIAPH